MTVNTGIRGNAGLMAEFDGMDYSGDIKAIRLVSEDKDDSDLTFEEAAQGETKDYRLAVTAIQSTEVGSFWRLLWDGPGSEFDVVYAPHGNAIASATQPHFTFTAKATGRPEIGGEAKRAKERFSFDYELEVLTAITLVTV